MRPRVDALVKNEIDCEILHGRIEELFDDFRDPVYLVDKEDISLFEVRGPRVGDSAGRPRPGAGLDLEELERQAILTALQRANWVQKDAAASLGISSRVMNYKIKKYNFKNPRWNRNKPAPAEH